MAITSEIIGKLGGAGVETVPVNVSSGSSPIVLHRVTVPAGEQILVAAVGSSPYMSKDLEYFPELQLGNIKSRPVERYGVHSVVAVITQSADVVLDRRGSSTARADFEGIIYTVKM